jgi:hypothetical protein
VSVALSASTIFCDDVRQEATGKQILIGVFQSTIIVPKLPHTQRLCLLTKLRVPLELPLLESGTARVSVPGQEERTFPLHFAAESAEQSEPADGATAREYSISLRMKLECVEPGLIKVALDTDHGPVNAGSLRIITAETHNRDAIDINALGAVVYHFIDHVKPQTPVERGKIALALFDVLYDLTHGKIQAQGSVEGFLFAQKSEREFFVLFGKPIKRGKPRLEVLKESKSIAHTVARGSPYHCLVTLTDAAGTKFNDGLTVKFKS